MSEGKRWSAKRKQEVALRFERGEGLDELSRETGQAASAHSAWCEHDSRAACRASSTAVSIPGSMPWRKRASMQLPKLIDLVVFNSSRAFRRVMHSQHVREDRL